MRLSVLGWYVAWWMELMWLPLPAWREFLREGDDVVVVVGVVRIGVGGSNVAAGDGVVRFEVSLG